MSMDISAFKSTRVFQCLECGKCTAVCPISRYNQSFSPRRMIGRMLAAGTEDLIDDSLLWTCLTCQLCNERCPQDVDFSLLMRGVRIEAFRAGKRPVYSHGGALQSTMRIMASPDLKQDRLTWIPKELKVRTKGEDVYFVGCLPYFDAFFTDIKIDTLTSAKSTIRLMNALDIAPAVMPDERCCGHDLLWMGDEDNFKRLAEHNLKKLAECGAKRVFFTCPEGYRTFSVDVPEYFGALDFEVVYFPAFLVEHFKELPLKSNGNHRVMTFHDACRLGRHMGDYDTPRNLLAAISGVELHEMVRHRAGGMCCGTSAWSNCDLTSKQIQAERLRDAKATGAEVLVTGCVKCGIHFTCTQNGPGESTEIQIPIKDLMTVVADELT
jgi:heterodisulfide reductase subunit D